MVLFLKTKSSGYSIANMDDINLNSLYNTNQSQSLTNSWGMAVLVKDTWMGSREGR